MTTSSNHAAARYASQEQPWSPNGKTPQIVVTALVSRGDEVLLTRSGPGPAGGRWSTPAVTLDNCETLAEAALRSVSHAAGIEGAICGPFVGWFELIDDESSGHVLAMCFEVVLIDQPAAEVTSSSGTAQQRASAGSEARWFATWEISELRLIDGLTEFLGDVGVIDLMA